MPSQKNLSDVRDGLVKIALAYTNTPGTKFEQGGVKFTITVEDLEDMRRNLAEREVPIDYDHLSAAAHQLPPGFAKAAGWLVRPDKIEDFTEGRKILFGWARFTPTMLAMIKQREYRYGSMDFRWKDKNEVGESVGTYMHAFAMTNRPFLKDLPPIDISDSDYQSIFGLAVRQDGKLAAITLSENGRLTSPEAVHVPSIIGGKQPGGKNMARTAFITKGKTRGKFAVRADDGSLDDLDDISMDDLFDAMADELDDLFASRGYKKYSTQMSRSGSATVQLSSLVKEVARDNQLTQEQARDRVLATPEGKAIWERMRQEELSESRRMA